MSTQFPVLTDLPIEDQEELTRISAIDSGSRNTTETAFYAARLPYITNVIEKFDANGDILRCSGITVPTSTTTGFAKGGQFIKIDAADGTKSLYENVGTNTSCNFNLIGDITESEIGDGAVTVPKLGTGLKGNVSHVFYVDGTRTDSYTETGSVHAPYKTIKAAQDGINIIAATLLDTQAHFESSKYIVNIAPGEYSDDLTITTCRYLRYNMEGVLISGDVSITQEQVGISDYYGKVEFVGSLANRSDKGKCGKISGDITFNKSAYDSLAYDAFIGIEITGDIKYGAAAGDGHGTWVLYLENTVFSSTSKSITTNFAAGAHCLLIETYGYNSIKSTLTGVIDLYDCNNTSFRNINITPYNGCKVKNSEFTGSVSIIASKTLSIDDNSYKSLIARTPTLTGMTISLLDDYLPVASAQEEIAAGTGGAINLTSFLTFISSDGTDDAFTLANGTHIRQQKKIIFRTDGGGNAVITGSFAGAATTLTMNDAGEYALLEWNGTDWIALELGSVIDLTNAPVIA